MKTTGLHQKLIACLLFGLLLPAAAACSTLQNPPAGSATPIASITAPANGSSFAAGQRVDIAFGAADVKGVSQVELTIDGQPARVEVVDPPVNTFAATHTWIPDTAGSHLIEVAAFNVDGATGETAQIVVTVTGAVAGAEVEATPTATPPAAVAPTLTPIVVVGRPTSTPESLPSATPVGDKAVATALLALNVRAGPGTAYPVVGRLAQGQSAEITGRDQYANWWQIVFPAAEGEQAWIAAGGEFSTAVNADNVPLVEIPPLPETAGASPTPSPEPDLLKPTIFNFTADRYNIAAGESVTLSWDLANAEAAYLRYGSVEEGVVAPGSKTVSPAETTVYTLAARNAAGETTAEVKITVGGATATPVPVWRDGKISIVNGQSIDFDQGVVQDTPGPESDFLWDASQQKFIPRGGASGAWLGAEYNTIDLETCLGATYGQPITGIDGSTLITGCYITTNGRYGKFYVSEWDLSGNLTVIWLTWDYR